MIAVACPATSALCSWQASPLEVNCQVRPAHRQHHAGLQWRAAARAAVPPLRQSPLLPRPGRAGAIAPRCTGSKEAAPQLTACLESVKAGNLVRAQLQDGRILYLEIVRRSRSGGAVEVLCEGELISLQPTDSGGIAASHAGYWPRPSDAWVKRCPGLPDALKAARRHQNDTGTLPSQLMQHHGVLHLHNLTSLALLKHAAEAFPGLWCDGTGPNDRPPTEEETAMLSAGELLTLLQGRRGVALLQLSLGIDSGVRPPLLRPFVLRLLRRAEEHKGVVIMPSVAAGGAATSLVLAAKQAPFRAWGLHLATVGVQASLVAGSPFYKLLIGRILGYKHENIVHHIEIHGGIVDGRVLAAVEEELKGLSGAQPQLPWDSRKGAPAQ